MPQRIAIATCREYPHLVDDDRPILAALAERGVAADVLVWDDDLDWTKYSAVLLRSVWDYFTKPIAFHAWLERLERARVPCWNPVPLVRWNMDKRYLRDLARKGVSVVETLWIDRGDGVTPESAAAEIAATGWPEIVVKPTVSAGAWRTERLRREEIASRSGVLADILSGSGLMAQPFLEEIERDGEISLVFFGGEFSHAVLKRPRAGDYRVQWTHGGSQAAWTPPPSIVKQALGVLEAAPSAGLYARVDGIVREGMLLLMELEQIEPYLYFAEAPAALDRFVAALRARM